MSEKTTGQALDIIGENLQFLLDKASLIPEDNLEDKADFDRAYVMIRCELEFMEEVLASHG